MKRTLWQACLYHTVIGRAAYDKGIDIARLIWTKLVLTREEKACRCGRIVNDSQVCCIPLYYYTKGWQNREHKLTRF